MLPKRNLLLLVASGGTANGGSQMAVGLSVETYQHPRQIPHNPDMRTCLLILAALCWCMTARGESLVLPPELCLPARPAEVRLWEDLADGRLDEFDLLEAALVAVDANPSQLNACRQVIAEQTRAWRAAGLESLPQPARAAMLFELMHKELLRHGYRLDASNLADAIQSGYFNCVSATLLWQHLAAEFGIKTAARQLPGHMQSVLITATGPQLIETTCPPWFSRQQASAASEPGVAGARQLNDAELIACVYYNHGLRLMTEGQFPAALAATYAAHRLDPENAAARGNLLAILNNWSLRLAEEGQAARALAILEAGLALAPEHESFAINLKRLRRAQSK